MRPSNLINSTSTHRQNSFKFKKKGTWSSREFTQQKTFCRVKLLSLRVHKRWLWFQIEQSLFEQTTFAASAFAAKKQIPPPRFAPLALKYSNALSWNSRDDFFAAADCIPLHCCTIESRFSNNVSWVVKMLIRKKGANLTYLALETL